MARSVETVESPLKIDLERKIRNVHRYYRRYYYFLASFCTPDVCILGVRGKLEYSASSKRVNSTILALEIDSSLFPECLTNYVVLSPSLSSTFHVKAVQRGSVSF